MTIHPVRIVLSGCCAETSIDMTATDEQLEFLQALAARSEDLSSGRMPVLFIDEAT